MSGRELVPPGAVEAPNEPTEQDTPQLQVGYRETWSKKVWKGHSQITSA